KFLRKHTKAEIIFDLHFVAAKEQSSLDKRLTLMALRHGHSFIVHAYKTADELKALFAAERFHLTLEGTRAVRADHDPPRAILKLYHPIYTLFKPDPNFNKEEWKR